MPIARATSARPYTRWLLLALSVVAAIAAFHVRGRPPREGDVIRLSFTVLPVDQYLCQCALPASVADHGCRYSLNAKGDAYPSRRPGAGTWIPLWTVDRMLYVVEGVFQDPSVKQAAKLAAERPRRDQRFVAHCRVKLARWIGEGKVRFKSREPWGPVIPNWMGQVVDCHADP